MCNLQKAEEYFHSRWMQNKQIKLNRVKKLNELRIQNQEERIKKSDLKAQKMNENLAWLAACEKMRLLRQIRKMREQDSRVANQKARELQENEQRRLEKVSFFEPRRYTPNTCLARLIIF